MHLDVIFVPFQCSILTEERLERLTKGIGMLDLDLPEGHGKEDNSPETSENILVKHNCAEDMLNGSMETSEISTEGSTPRKNAEDGNHVEHHMLEGDFDLLREGIRNGGVFPINSGTEILTSKGEPGVITRIFDVQGISGDEFTRNKQIAERRLPEAVLPLLRYYQYESSESSIRYMIAVFWYYRTGIYLNDTPHVF